PAQVVGLAVEVEGLAQPGAAVGGAAGDVLADAAGEAEGIAAEGGRQVGAFEQVPDELVGAGGVAAVDQGEGAAVEQVVVAGVAALVLQPTGGDLEGEGGVALPEQEAGEAAEQFRALPPDAQ